MLFFLGLYDDKYKLNPLKRLVLSILFIFIAIFLNNNLLITNFSLSFYGNRIFWIIYQLCLRFSVF